VSGFICTGGDGDMGAPKESRAERAERKLAQAQAELRRLRKAVRYTLETSVWAYGGVYASITEDSFNSLKAALKPSRKRGKR
jgi:hypothetical protein